MPPKSGFDIALTVEGMLIFLFLQIVFTKEYTGKKVPKIWNKGK
jgi:hypothetical protein